mmetsp:Transcript_31866/g.77651  ORF Transcript_31866/g.77651 Transcript_31866/m.77651 type:complete len:203 (+) Transcript_31866:1759-2367(+)
MKPSAVDIMLEAPVCSPSFWDFRNSTVSLLVKMVLAFSKMAARFGSSCSLSSLSMSELVTYEVHRLSSSDDRPLPSPKSLRTCCALFNIVSPFFVISPFSARVVRFSIPLSAKLPMASMFFVSEMYLSMPISMSAPRCRRALPASSDDKTFFASATMSLIWSAAAESRACLTASSTDLASESRLASANRSKVPRLVTISTNF